MRLNKRDRLYITLTCILSFSAFASETTHKHWSYEGSQGPSHWGKIASEWHTCENGKQQSPINLMWKKPKTDRKIETHYTASPFEVLDNGHTIQANFEKGNFVEINNDRYQLIQLHFHARSEHSIGKKFFPLEMHFVHANADGKIAVLGVMFEEGAANSELEKIFAHIPQKKNHKEKVSARLNFNAMIPNIRTHYNYTGSLTTPPCSEGVDWNVFNTPITASAEQIQKFTKLYSANFRPIQGLNGRVPANF